MRYFNLVCGVVVASLFVCAVQQAQAIQFQSNLVMHFDAKNVETSGSDVTKWLNTGTTGATLDATPDIPGNFAESVSSVAAINNQPVVRFVAANEEALRTGALGSDIPQPLTIFHVGMMTSTSGAPFYYDGRVDLKRATMYYANSASDSIFAGSTLSGTGGVANQFNSWAAIYNGTQSFINRNGTALVGPGNSGTQPIDGLTIGARFAPSNEMNGDIAEIAIFSGLFNAAQLKIASNHYSAKYQLPVDTNLYDGDNNGAGGYDFNVFGIGNSGAITGFAAGTVTTGTEGRGLTFNSTGSLDVDDFVLAGDQNLANGFTTDDVPNGFTRWERVWNVDQTGESDVEFEFDSIAAGLGALDLDQQYQLLYSATDPYEFSIFSSDYSISGNTVSFAVLGTELLDGFYTLSSAPPVPEPSSLLLMSLGLGVVMVRRRKRRS